MFCSLMYVLLTVTSTLLVEGNRLSRLEKRLNVLEKRILEDAITYRGDIEMILKKLDEISNKTSEVSHVREEEAENIYENSEIEVKDDKFIQIIKKTMNAEKQHIRNVLLKVRKETETVKNDFTDTETKIFEKQKEQDIMFGQFKQDFIFHMTEMQKRYGELDRKVENNCDSNKELFNKQLESKYNELSKEINVTDERLNSRIDENVEKLRILSIQSCSDGTWDLFGGSCYYVGAEFITWEEAVTKCASLGSYLVEVNSDAENTFLIKLAKENVNHVSWNGVWLGGSDRSKEGTWTWETSEREIFNTYSNFKGSEPNGKTSENCLHLGRGGNWNWNDISCNIRMSFFCERGLLFN